MEESRREKSAKNLIYAWLNQGVMLVMNIVVRIVFVRVLSKDYLGLSGLFGNMISLLSLAELGIGTAIIYSLYEPLAHQDQRRINSLMRFFQRVYIFIGAVILTVGVAMTPYLSVFIKEMPEIPEIRKIYLLFVINAAISYCFSYKGSLISADQKDYIIKKIRLITTTAMYILQISILFLTENYLAFLWIQIGSTVVQNLLYTWIANRMYPFLKNEKADRIEKESLSEILKNTKALMLHKVGEVVKFSTDNLIISKFVGLQEVGLYSNYTLIQQALMNILSQIFTSMTASVGNLGVTSGDEKKYQIFCRAFFLNAWSYGFCGTAFLCLAQDFLGVFFGKEYLMDQRVLFLIVLNFYLVGMRKTTLTFRDAFGLFWQNRYMPIAESGINLVLSLVLVQKFGIIGVLLGTVLSTVLLPWWIEPYIVFRDGLKRGILEYWKQYWKYTAITAISVVITWQFCEHLPLEMGIIRLVIKGCICFVLPNCIYFLIYRSQEEYEYFREFAVTVKEKIMKSEKIHKIVDWLAAGVLMVGLCLTYISKPFYDKMTGYVPIIGFVVLAILFFNHINWIERLKKKEPELILLILGVVIAGVNLVLAKSGYGVIFNIADFLLVLYLAGKVKLDQKVYYAVGLTCLLILGSWIGKGDKNFNTNHASTILFAVSTFGLTAVTAICDRYQKVTWGKGITLAVMGCVVLPIVWNLRARCVLVGIAVFVILNYLIPACVWGCKKLYRACVVLLIGGSIGFPLWYVWLSKSDVTVSIVTLGKGFFTGRNDVWDQFLTAFYKEPLTGIGSDFAAKIPDLLFSEVHNGLLHILVVHGIFVFCIVVYFLGKRLFQIGDNAAQSRVARQCASVIISLAAVSVFETYFILPFFNILILLLFCLGIDNVAKDRGQISPFKRKS